MRKFYLVCQNRYGWPLVPSTQQKPLRKIQKLRLAPLPILALGADELCAILAIRFPIPIAYNCTRSVGSLKNFHMSGANGIFKKNPLRLLRKTFRLIQLSAKYIFLDSTFKLILTSTYFTMNRQEGFYTHCKITYCILQMTP